MALTATIPGIISLLAWLYLLVAHGAFWRIGRLDLLATTAIDQSARVSVVIPARDEADSIGATIQSLLSQRGVPAVHIFVVDDHSSDGTAETAQKAAAAAGCPGALTVVRGRELPLGWTGKLWAVQQGLEQALALQPDFVLLTDADIVHAQDNLARLIATAGAGNYALTTLMVKLNCRNLAEKLLIPAFVFFFFLLYPPAWIREDRRRTAGAAGGCMLVRPSALEKAGGIRGIRSEIIDDCALASAVKRTGGRLWLGLANDTFSTRSYGSFAEIEQMISRTAFNQLRHSIALLVGSTLGLTIVFVVPVLMVVSGTPSLMLLGWLSWALMCVAYAPMVRYYGLNVGWVITLPLAATFYMAATVHSAVKFWTGRGGEWKGRSQDPADVQGWL